MLSLVGFVAIFVFTYYTYKTAKDYGKKAGLWALLAFSVGFGVQFILPFAIGMMIGVYLLLTGPPAQHLQEALETPAGIIGVISFVLSLVGMFLVIKYVARVPDVDEPTSSVPPPPQFSGQI